MAFFLPRAKLILSQLINNVIELGGKFSLSNLGHEMSSSEPLNGKEAVKAHSESNGAGEPAHLILFARVSGRTRIFFTKHLGKE